MNLIINETRFFTIHYNWVVSTSNHLQAGKGLLEYTIDTTFKLVN